MTGTADRREITAIFGSLRPSADRGATLSRSTSEADLRRSLASVAHAYGWLVDEEVVVPGWGRIDLILRDGFGHPRLVELKLELTKPARIRRGLQQADGYGRWWTQKYGQAVNTYLVGLDFNRTEVDALATAYPSVAAIPCEQFLGGLVSWGESEGRAARQTRSDQRVLEVRRIVDAYASANHDLEMDLCNRVLRMQTGAS